MTTYEFRIELAGPDGPVTLMKKGHRQGRLCRGQSLRFASEAEDYWLRIKQPPDDQLLVWLCADGITHERLVFEGWKEIST